MFFFDQNSPSFVGMLEALAFCDLVWKSEEKLLNRMKRKADLGLGVESGTFQNGHVNPLSLFHVTQHH